MNVSVNFISYIIEFLFKEKRVCFVYFLANLGYKVKGLVVFNDKDTGYGDNCKKAADFWKNVPDCNDVPDETIPFLILYEPDDGRNE